MRPLSSCLATTPLLAGCALLDGPLPLDEIGLTPGKVLQIEQEELASRPGRRIPAAMSAITGVDNLHCISAPYGRAIPNCRYRLRYRKSDGTDGAAKVHDRFFRLGEDGQWERVLIVRGD